MYKIDVCIIVRKDDSGIATSEQKVDSLKQRWFAKDTDKKGMKK